MIFWLILIFVIIVRFRILWFSGILRRKFWTLDYFWIVVLFFRLKMILFWRMKMILFSRANKIVSVFLVIILNLLELYLLDVLSVENIEHVWHFYFKLKNQFQNLNPTYIIINLNYLFQSFYWLLKFLYKNSINQSLINTSKILPSLIFILLILQSRVLNRTLVSVFRFWSLPNQKVLHQLFLFTFDFFLYKIYT